MRRDRELQRSRLQSIVEAHEQAGDLAREHHLYDDAAQSYQRALNVKETTVRAKLRISGKLSHVLFRSSNPNTTNLRVESILPSHFETQSEASTAVGLLLEQVSQLWTAAQMNEAFPLLSRATRIAREVKDAHLLNIVTIKTINHLCIQGRFEEAHERLREIRDFTDRNDSAFRVHCFSQKALIHAGFGRTDAYEDWNEVLQALGDDADPYRVSAVWEGYAHCALMLGNMLLAKSCTERALLIARQNQVAWRVPYLCLSYASILKKMGQHEAAYSYLLNATSYDNHAPIINILLAEVGIPLAMHMKDEAMLMRCANAQTMSLAFQSEVPDWFAPVAAAFARLYVVQGNTRKAQQLLHRTLELVGHLNQMGDVLLAIAQYGLETDFARARALLQARASLPSPDIVNACSSLFEAYIAQRRREHAKAQDYAVQAAEQYEALHWYGYADRARALLPEGHAMFREVAAPRADVKPQLTTREQQVIELVLRGFTNRAIADALTIKERTVEAHMTSIMTHLGVRSRYQIVDHLENPKP